MISPEALIWASFVVGGAIGVVRQAVRAAEAHAFPERAAKEPAAGRTHKERPAQRRVPSR